MKYNELYLMSGLLREWFSLKKEFQCFVALLFLMVCSTSNAQVSAYTFSEDISGYTPLPVTALEVYPGGWDNHTAGAATLINYGFDFVYNGITYTECYVSPNGYITFGATQPLPTTYTPISTNTAHEGVISALGFNLIDNSGSSPIRYEIQGTSPNRVFVVQWENAERTTDPGVFNFQIKLYETSNQIQVSYGNCVPEGTTARAVQVGLRGPNTTFPNNGNVGNVLNRLKTSNTPWFGTTLPGTANTSNVRTIGNTLPFPAPPSLAYPDLGLTYTWTPPTANCVTPSASPTGLVIGGTNTTFNSFVGNSFTPATPNSTHYLVLRSLVNTPPTAAEVINGGYWAVNNTIAGTYTVVSNAPSTITTFNQTALAPGTTYYYWVIPYNDNCIGAPFYRLSNILTASATTCTPTAVATAATAINGNGFTLNWNDVAIATDYRIDISTNATFTNILPAYNNLSVGLVNSLTVSDLTTATNYWYRVRAIGPGPCAINSNTINVGVLPCGYYNIPYTQNFDTSPIGGLAPCFTRVNDNADVIQWGVQTASFASSPRAMFIAKNPTVDMNDWFFMPGLNLTGGTSYRLFFRYNTGAAGTFFENLRVRIGNSQDVAGMNITLLDLLNINNTSFQVASVDFTPVSTGIYYIGFYSFSIADQSFIAIDDISVTISPTCFEPTDVQVVSVTNNSADVSWTASVPPPSGGYQYYYSTSATPPTIATVPSGSVGAGVTSTTISGLTASTFYYLWVRGFCGGVDRSIWSEVQTFTTECNAPLVTSSSGASRCGVGTLNLTATPNPGSFIEWYDVPTGGLSVFTGNNFTTPLLSTTTVYYAQAKAFGATAKAGPTSPATLGGTIATSTSPTSMSFDVLNSTTIQAVDIFPLASGQSGEIVLRNSFNVTIATFPFTTSVTGGNTPQTIALNYPLPVGTYNLFIGSMPTSGLRSNTTGASYPYVSSIAQITGNPLDNTSYFFFYNWKFTTECVSPRIAVTATVASPPAFSLSSAIQTICNGETTPFISVSGAASYDNFTWSPNTGVTGSVGTGYQFNPTTTTTYTLIASQTSGAFCTNVATITVTVNPLPPAIAIVPVSATLCENTIQPLSASVGSTTATIVYSEDFNSSAPGWVAANTSIAGDVAASQWALQTSPYNYGSPNWTYSFSSNDASTFFLANSDSQGETTQTRTTLTSPPIDLSVYVSASVTFWHWLRYVASDVAQVSVSTDGTTWTVLETFLSSQRVGSNWVQHTLNLDAYVGNPNVQIRFYYQSNWGWAWGVDNFEVTAAISLEVLWSPDTELFTDAAATVPYTLGTPIGIVYAQPTSTRTYTATALGTNGCSTFEDILITVDPTPIGGTLSGSQVLCSGTVPTAITLSGYSGTIVRWESADDAAFTVNLTTIANTTDTLTPVQMGVITSVKYFRAVIQSGICPLVYSSVESVQFPTTVWNGTSWSNGLPDNTKRVIFAGSYTSSGDLEACSIEVQSGTVTVLANHNFIVNNQIDVTGAPATTNFIFENNASLIQINDVVNTGPITYRRNSTPMISYDYTYWSSPVANQNLGSFSPNTIAIRFYLWDTGIYNWANISTATSFVAGRGYIIRAPGIAPFNLVTPNIFNGQFVGIPHNGDITVPIVVNGLNDRNLIGNPYPSAISADDFMDDPSNAGVVGGTIYFWTHNTPITNNQYTSNDYAVYNYTGGVGTQSATNLGINNTIPDGTIAAGQGFFMKCAGTGTATFKNSMRLLGSNTQFFRMSGMPLSTQAEGKNRLWIELSNNQGGFKQLLLGYVNGATNDFDFKYDGELTEAGNPVRFYSLLDDKKLTIQGRALPFQDSDIHPIGYTVPTQGMHTIQLATYDGLFTNQQVYLEDKVLNVIHDLKSSPYSFFTEEGTFDDRFLLRFTNETLGVNPFTVQDVMVFKKDLNIEILASADMLLDKVNLFDMRGRLIASKENINANTTTFTELNFASQILLVQIYDVFGNTVTRKLIF
ncbi:MAG TPA: T9SS sorting signal type C domain-containing protein [Flavobacterium sp.]|uniref:fibronectin type III domain-containing protein n=1 Tax=unclassified Flavobacterium TaxID=196869 RepID=UPI000E7FDE4B|nr:MULTISPECIES: T9SS sorting signal type C domain-containing protein [unclassified Flavobacterium]HBI01287.1 hypothetical protein [Flavobacterium sp.]HRE78344.1 T9SS sorting signal type C domain-containing protein [Flavobacterium sp.]